MYKTLLASLEKIRTFDDGLDQDKTAKNGQYLISISSISPT